MENKQVIMKLEFGNRLANYLSSKPWQEVHVLLEELLSLQPYVEPVIEKVEKVIEEKG